MSLAYLSRGQNVQELGLRSGDDDIDDDEDDTYPAGVIAST